MEIAHGKARRRPMPRPQGLSRAMVPADENGGHNRGGHARKIDAAAQQLTSSLVFDGFILVVRRDRLTDRDILDL